MEYHAKLICILILIGWHVTVSYLPKYNLIIINLFINVELKPIILPHKEIYHIKL